MPQNTYDLYNSGMERNFRIRDYQSGESDLAADIRGLKTAEDREHFKKVLEGDAQWVGHYKHLALLKNEEIIGDIQLRRCHQTMPPGVAHIGIEIVESSRGQGAGTMALELIWGWAQENGFHRLEGSTDVSNAAMQGAFKKAGWAFEGILKNLFMEDGKGHDYLSYAKTI
jgi:RimJ/RimL family protein N-acetyltransferase